MTMLAIIDLICFLLVPYTSKPNIVKVVRVAKTIAAIAAVVNLQQQQKSATMIPKKVEKITHNIRSIRISNNKNLGFNIFNKAML